jgi:cytochrome c55X
MRQAAAGLVLAALGGLAAAGSAQTEAGGTAPDPISPPAARQQVLLRMVRQDCGSCHGLRLTGGLGPALTREALADKPLESMAVTIHAGRPGTPMPPWKPFMSAEEARWIAAQLARGLPAEAGLRP